MITNKKEGIMKKFFYVLFLTLNICAMDAPAEKLLEEIKKGDDSSIKKHAAHLLSNNTQGADFARNLLTTIQIFREQQDPRVVELQRLIDAPVKALETADRKRNLQKATADILQARTQIWWQEYVPILRKFCLTFQHKFALEQLQGNAYCLLNSQLLNYFQEANITAQEIKEVIEEFKKIYPAITESLRQELTTRLMKITNPELLVGMVTADVVDERTLFESLDIRMGRVFIERQPTATRTQDLVNHCLLIDELVYHKQHRILKEKYPTLTEPEFQKEKEHQEWHTSRHIVDLRALRQTAYECLQKTKGDKLPLNELFYAYINKALLNYYQKINEIGWFLDKKEFNAKWQSPKGTTALDQIIVDHIKLGHEHTLEYVNLLRAAGVPYSGEHQAKIEDLVKRKGRSDQRFDGLVTQEDREKAQASSEYRRSLELLTTLYPNNAFSHSKVEELD